MVYKIVKKILISVLFLTATVSFAACSSDKITSLRNGALVDFKANKYVLAEQKLARYYDNQCGFYEMSQEDDVVFNKGLWLISDLMLYREKLGDQLGCLALSNAVYSTWMVSDPARYAESVDLAIKMNSTKCEAKLDALYTKAEMCPIKGYENMLMIPSDWKEQDELYYEISCLRFVENSGSERGMERDGAKQGSEGLGGIAKLEVLYVDLVEKLDGSTLENWLQGDENDSWERFYNEGWLLAYKLNEVYFSSSDGELFGDDYCYELTPRFGKKAGMIYLDGGSSPCHGGSAGYLDALIVQLDYPFKAQIIQVQKQ